MANLPNSENSAISEIKVPGLNLFILSLLIVSTLCFSLMCVVHGRYTKGVIAAAALRCMGEILAPCYILLPVRY